MRSLIPTIVFACVGGLAFWYAVVVLILFAVVGLPFESALRQAPALVAGGVLAGGVLLLLVAFGLDVVINARGEQ